MARDKTLAKLYRNQPCIVCGLAGEGDHILNYSGIKKRDCHLNLWTLCRSHHTEKGQIGLTKFARKHQVEPVLLGKGFWHDEKSWKHEKLAK